MKKIIYKITFALLLGASFASCSEDALDPSHPTLRDTDTQPLATDQDLTMLVNGMYKRMAAPEYYGRDYIIFGEARTDNAFSAGYSNRFVTVSQYRINIGDAYPNDTWLQIYRIIHSANLILNAPGITGDADAITEAKAQAYAFRALAHFDLMKLYGQQHVQNGGVSALGVPYRRTSDVNSTTNVRNTVAEIRQYAYEDLDLAIETVSNTSKIKFTKQALHGLKARMALYFGTFFPEDYALAKTEAELAINEGGSIILEGDFIPSFASGDLAVNSVFDIGVPADDHNSSNGLFEIYNGQAYGDIVLTDDVWDVFEEGDIRKDSLMINYDSYEDLRNIGKYTQERSNIKIVRFEELVLTLAEASFRTGDVATALESVNQIVTNRGLVAYTSITLEDILKERRRELMFEGFRFDDMMRTNQDIPVSPQLAAPVVYGSTTLAFPIPLREINASGMTQNQGY